MSDLTIGEILDQRTPTERSVLVTMDGALHDRIVAQRRMVAAARLVDLGTLDSPVPRLERELKELLVEEHEAGQRLTFRAIPRADYERIVRESPPTVGQADDGYIFDPDVFGPKIISASSHAPEIDEDAAERLWNEWSRGDVDAVFQAAYGVNVEARVHPFVEGSRPTPSFEPNSATAFPEASPTASS